MIRLLRAAALVAMTASFFHASAADAVVFFGTYTREGGSQGIYAARLDPASGRLGSLSLAAVARNPSFLALSPDGRFLYAAIEAGGGAIGAFRVLADGGLSALNEIASGGAGPCHIAVDATGRNVLVANYGGGSIAVFRTGPDGSLDERTAFVQFTGSGPNPGRQSRPQAHAISTDPSNSFVYACDLGTDNVWSFRFDAARGELTPTDPPSGRVPPGGGPRHIVFRPDGKFAYVNNEMGMSVTVFARDPASGLLDPIQTVSTLPAGESNPEWKTSEIALHPSGRWLYVSNRGPDTIAVFAVGADGRLTWTGAESAEVQTPRGFAIDPGGRWLVSAGQDDDRITALAIDPETGRLKPAGQAVAAGAPVCVVFAPPL